METWSFINAFKQHFCLFELITYWNNFLEQQKHRVIQFQWQIVYLTFVIKMQSKDFISPYLVIIHPLMKSSWI